MPNLPDISSLDDFGGPMANYSAVVDPTTDESAIFRNRYACNVAMMGHTAPRALCRFVTVNGGAPTDPASNVHDALWGSSVPYKPAVARTAEGIWTCTLPATVDDELTPEAAALGGGETHTVSIRYAIAFTTPVAGVLKLVSCEITSARVVTVYGFLANGTADDIPGAVVTVVIW